MKPEFVNMNQHDITTAATIIWRNWGQSTRIAELPADCRPANRAEAYAIQAELARLSEQSVAGWKIAATSLAGQKHIGVDGPLAGRLLAGRVFEAGANVSLDGNLMRVGEAEFAFRFGRSLPKREEPYDVEEVLAAVEFLHPAIEIPDSRYHDFARVGAPQLIADDACACWFVLGPATDANWREHDLALHNVVAYKNGAPAATGSGANVLGDPRVALTWIANELSVYGDGLRAGEFVTTGTCVAPVPIAPGDRLRMDFEAFGAVEAILS
jgi:2-keto-4-pentenoate hydratase